MAGVSMKDIKSRIKSMESTKQITKAMEMVAASKLRGAQERAIASRPYFEVLYQTMHDIADANTDLTSAFVRKPRGEKYCFVVIAGDRGLAGGYNNNVLKLAMSEMAGKDVVVQPIGKRPRNISAATMFPSSTRSILWPRTSTRASASPWQTPSARSTLQGPLTRWFCATPISLQS